MARAKLSIIDADRAAVWRVGRAPDPWAWIPREYAGANRWDDIDGVFRTVYAGDTRYACFVEVLAWARPEIGLLDGIVEEESDAADHPTPPPGAIPRSWIGARMIGRATLTGRYVDVRAARTIAALRNRFAPLALALGYPDFDAAALKSGHPRELTQRVASHLYAAVSDSGEMTFDGVYFASRFGDELTMWAIFERPGDDPISMHLDETSTSLVSLNDPALLKALALHGLFLGP